MVARLTVVLDDDDVRKTIGAIPKHVYRSLRRAFDADGAEWDAAMALRTAGGGTRRRTGGLARSIGYAVTGERIEDLEMHGFSTSKSAPLLEFGGTVRPVRTRYLTIPTDDNLRAGSGTPRWSSARALKNSDPKNVFFLRLPSGGLYMVQRTSNDLKFMFRLVTQTRHPGPQGVRPAPRPGGSYLGFYHEWGELADERRQRHRRAVGKALANAVKE